MKKSEYDLQAEKFLNDTGTTLEIFYTGTRPHFPSDKEARDVYSVTLKRGTKSYTFDFGDSIANTKKRGYGEFRTASKPSAYSILSCLSGYEPESNIDDFAAEYGYTKISEAIRVHNAVKAEYKALAAMYNESELVALGEIQ